MLIEDNKTLKSEIIQKIDTLFIYASTMPDKTKARFISHLDRIKEEISLSINNVSVSSNPASKSEPSASPSVRPQKQEAKEKKKQNNDLVTSKQNLVSLTSVLIPKITQKGRNKIDDLSTPLKLYTMLKLLDETSSLWELYTLYSYNFENYLDYLNVVYELETKKYINFIKIENLAKDIGWLKIGELLIESEVIHEINVTNAANYKRTSKGMLIGEAMVELRFITEPVLKDGLKIQKWLSDLSNKAIYIEGIINSAEVISGKNKNNDTLSTNASNILDFIIPIFNDSDKVFLSAPDNDFATKLSVIDEQSSLIKIFENNKLVFHDNKLEFYDFILKLDSQELLSYKKNEEVETRETWIRFGELAVTLGLATVKQIDETFEYRHINYHRKIYIGEALVELGYLHADALEEILKIQRWCNTALAKLSYETALITAIKEVLEIHFKNPIEMGRFRKITFHKPLKNMICITYTISGKLNGQVYYIFDKGFAENLSRELMKSYGMELQDLDESIISELCNILTGSSLTKLSKIGIFCETNIPKIEIHDEIIVANKQSVSALPLMSKFGRLVIGFLLR